MLFENADSDHNNLVLPREEVEKRDDCLVFQFVSPFRPPTCKLPQRGSTGAAGYDLCAPRGGKVLPNGGRFVVCTGVKISKFPKDCYGRIVSRSSLGFNHGIEVGGGGVIDPDYTGELKVLLYNHSRVPFNISPGARIAQIIFEQFKIPTVYQAFKYSNECRKVNEFKLQVRGVGGFGSTGK